MRVYGVDFTSAPRRQKPITAAVAALRGRRLVLEDVLRLSSFTAFEGLLRTPGPWIGGFDFPFGLPRELVTDLGWPGTWPALVAHCSGLTREEWRKSLDAYRATRPVGRKYAHRATDLPAGSSSPVLPETTSSRQAWSCFTRAGAQGSLARSSISRRLCRKPWLRKRAWKFSSCWVSRWSCRHSSWSSRFTGSASNGPPRSQNRLAASHRGARASLGRLYGDTMTPILNTPPWKHAERHAHSLRDQHLLPDTGAGQIARREQQADRIGGEPGHVGTRRDLAHDRRVEHAGLGEGEAA